MSTKKKKSNLESSGIKSFFAPKSGTSSTKASSSDAAVSSSNFVDLLCSDNEEKQSTHSKSSKIPTSTFFMSKAAQIDLIAQERELRIQEEIARVRKETNTMLTSSGLAEKKAKDISNSFFQARPKVVMLKQQSTSTDEIEKIEETMENIHQLLFPAIQHCGLICSVQDLTLHRNNLLFDAANQRVTRNTTYNSDNDWNDYPEDSLRKLIGCANTAPADVAAWSAQEFGVSFSPRNAGRGTAMNRNVAAVGRCRMYPLAQASLTLRALWMQWVVACDAAVQGKGWSGGHEETTLIAPVTKGLSAQKALASWLKQWAGKRRASLSRSSTGSTRSRLNRNNRSSTCKVSQSATNSRSRKKRALSDSDSSEEEMDFSEDEVSEESDGLCDSSEEEVATPFRCRTKASTSTCSTDIGMEEEESLEALTNVMVLEGPSGSGKSAAVHQCARALGYRVIEVNASQTRNGPSIKKTIAEAAQSSHITSQTQMLTGTTALEAATSGTGGAEMSLILFDEVDIVFEEEGDTQLYSAIQQIAQVSKCPIVLTTEQPLPFFKALHAKHVKFSRPGTGSDEALEALRAAAIAVTTLARSPSLNELPVRHAASSFFQAKPASTGQVSPESSDSASALTLPRFNSRDESMLRVLCALCDGDIRAALATLQCLPDRFIQHPCAAVTNRSTVAADAIDLTESPITSSKTPRAQSVAVIPSVSAQSSAAATEVLPFFTFEQFLADFASVDFALFERLLHSFAHIKYQSIVSTYAVPVAPVVCEVSPRSGLCSGGFLVTISGAHFLQWAQFPYLQDQPIECAAQVRVLLGGIVECPCQIKSDDTIVAYIPAVESEGVHSLTVEIQFGIGKLAQRSFSVRSDICGVANGWIRLSRRTFPTLRTSLSGNLRMPIHRSMNSIEDVALSTVPTAQGGPDSGADTNIEDSSDDGKENVDAASGQSDCILMGKKVLGKRLRRVNHSQLTKFTVPEDDEAMSSDTLLSSQVVQSKRRRGRIVVENEEETEEQNPQQLPLTVAATEDSDEHSAVPTELASSCEGENQRLQLVEEQTVERICTQLTAAMQCALQTVQENMLSDPFLEPVSELDVPGYSSVIKSPMDLGTVADSLAERLYTTERTLRVEGIVKSVAIPDVVAFVQDVRQIWKNCIIFNGTTAPLVRSAYLLEFLFDRTLRNGINELQSTVAAAEVEIDAHGVLRLQLTGLEVQELFVYPVDDVFERCTKLRKGLTEARMLSVLEEKRRLIEPTEVVLTQEEALEPEFVDPAHLLVALQTAQTLRDQRQAALCRERVNSKRPVPGLRVMSAQPQDRPGQECETCVDSAVCVLPLCVDTDSSVCLEALHNFVNRADIFCDADVFTSIARRMGSYGCCEHEDTSADSSFVDFNPLGSTALPIATSFAEDVLLAKHCGIYGQWLRASAVCGVDSAVSPTHCPSSRGSTLTESTMCALGSRHLAVELSRVEISRTAFAVINGYTCSAGNRTSSGLASHCMVSQCFIPRSLALDALPLLSAMVRCEQENDKDALELISAGEASGLKASEYSLSGRRSSRRSASTGVRSHQCFQYMTSALCASEELVRKIICMDFP